MKYTIKNSLLAGFLAFIFQSVSAQIIQDKVSQYSNEISRVNINNKVINPNNGIDVYNGLVFTHSNYEKTNSLTKSGEEITKKIFNVNIENPGAYYFAAHVLPANLYTDSMGQFHLQTFKVYVNNEYVGNLSVTTPEWELAPLKDLTISLDKGVNIVSIESEAPFYPEVDAIRITKNLNDLIIDNPTYDYYKSTLRNKGEVSIVPFSAFTTKTDWQVNPKNMITPFCQYVAKTQVPIAYTYYRKLSLKSGRYVFHTGPVTNDDWTTVDPVMYLFKENDPYGYSFYNDDYNTSTYGYQSKITANLSDGDYYLVVHCKGEMSATYPNGREGLVNIYMNEQALNTNCPVSGYRVNINMNNKGSINYFTSQSTGIPKIFLIENGSNKMRFIGSTYFYINGMDQMWFDDARVQLDKQSDATYTMLISAEGAMGYNFGNCDVYGAVQLDKNNQYVGMFSNLKQGDALISGSNSGSYNSASWAGGLTNKLIWIGSSGSPSTWKSWKDYFGNNPARYEGAVNYSTSYNGSAKVVSYSTNNTEEGIQHFACTGDANMHTHGYAWESKIGVLGRIFHPVTALNNSSFGNVYQYYRVFSQRYNARGLNDHDTSNDEYTLEESLRNGLSIIEQVELDDKQKEWLSCDVIQNRLGESDIHLLYNEWYSTINSDEYKMKSNPYAYFDNKEGKELIKYAKSDFEQATRFFAKKFFEDANNNLEENLIPYLYCEIAKDGYGYLIDAIKDDWRINQYTESGEYKIPLPEIFTKKYIKSIIDLNYLDKNEVKDTVMDNNEPVFNIIGNPLKDNSEVHIEIPKKSNVSLYIVDAKNGIVQSMVKNKEMPAGNYTYSINTNSITNGMSICVLEIDNIKLVRKMMKFN